MSIELLTPDWLNSTYQSSGFFGETFVEAPAMFKDHGTYYAVGRTLADGRMLGAASLYQSSQVPMVATALWTLLLLLRRRKRDW